MEEIELSELSMLLTHFDPVRWQAQNPQPHWSVYKLNPEQLKDWGAVVTEIRKKIVKKAENYKQYSGRAAEPEFIQKSRRSIPHSTRNSNPEGLLEL